MRNASVFQCFINGTIASGVFSRPSTTKSTTGRAWFASGFIGLYLCYTHPTSQTLTAWPTEAVFYERFDRASREMVRFFFVDSVGV